jgi:hypothetical protein
MTKEHAQLKWVLVRVIRPANQAWICFLSGFSGFYAPKFSQPQAPCKFSRSPWYNESHLHLPILVLTIYNKLRALEFAGNCLATLIEWEILDVDQVVGFLCGIRKSA